MPKIAYRQSVHTRVNTVKCVVDGVTCFTIESRDNNKSWRYFGAYRGEPLSSGEITVPLALAKEVISTFITARAPREAKA